jgi:hypothetical protein
MAPVFTLIALTFFIIARMGMGRAGAITAGNIKIRDIALSDQAWADDIKKVSNNYGNLLQLPVIMYVAVAFFIVLGKVDLLAVVLAWGFALARLAHTYIHIGSNHVPRRFRIFGLGIAFLIAMWVWLALRIYITG